MKYISCPAATCVVAAAEARLGPPPSSAAAVTDALVDHLQVRPHLRAPVDAVIVVVPGAGIATVLAARFPVGGAERQPRIGGALAGVLVPRLELPVEVERGAGVVHEGAVLRHRLQHGLL